MNKAFITLISEDEAQQIRAATDMRLNTFVLLHPGDSSLSWVSFTSRWDCLHAMSYSIAYHHSGTLVFVYRVIRTAGMITSVEMLLASATGTDSWCALAEVEMGIACSLQGHAEPDRIQRWHVCLP
jgi:hypothetical protein